MRLKVSLKGKEKGKDINYTAVALHNAKRVVNADFRRHLALSGTLDDVWCDAHEAAVISHQNGDTLREASNRAQRHVYHGLKCLGFSRNTRKGPRYNHESSHSIEMLDEMGVNPL